ncbi:hypothetical protein X975_10066, partial [Stegodyphus mimosarum]
MSLKPKALVILNNALNPVNVKLVDICNRRFRPTKKKPEMGVEVAYKAVTTVFNNEVRNHALAAGHNALLKFRYGYTLYKRKGTKQIRRKQKEKRRVALAHEFKTGVPAIVRIVYPEAKIDPKARNVMCTFLNVLSARIMKKVKDLNSETATAVDVKNAVEAILPHTMAEHAKAEGSKMVFTLEINGFTFIPKYHKRRKRRSGVIEEGELTENISIEVIEEDELPENISSEVIEEAEQTKNISSEVIEEGKLKENITSEVIEEGKLRKNISTGVVEEAELPENISGEVIGEGELSENISAIVINSDERAKFEFARVSAVFYSIFCDISLFLRWVMSFESGILQISISADSPIIIFTILRQAGQAPVIVNLEPLIQQLPSPTSAPPTSPETS